MVIQFLLIKRIVGKPSFKDEFKNIIQRYESEYHAPVCMPGCEPIMVYSHGFLFTCPTLGQASDLMMTLM